MEFFIFCKIHYLSQKTWQEIYPREKIRRQLREEKTRGRASCRTFQKKLIYVKGEKKSHVLNSITVRLSVKRTSFYHFIRFSEDGHGLVKMSIKDRIVLLSLNFRDIRRDFNLIVYQR
ncbi:hypothetical protein TNCV_1935141 [Trichonephila clavipes]|nr:hypothetical protein TNCV_1935141 [Trichonephila clavipes]